MHEVIFEANSSIDHSFESLAYEKKETQTKLEEAEDAYRKEVTKMKDERGTGSK